MKASEYVRNRTTKLLLDWANSHSSDEVRELVEKALSEAYDKGGKDKHH